MSRAACSAFSFANASAFALSRAACSAFSFANASAFALSRAACSAFCFANGSTVVGVVPAASSVPSGTQSPIGTSWKDAPDTVTSQRVDSSARKPFATRSASDR